MTTFPDSHRDLRDAQVGSLATIGANGFPQLTEIWFLYDEAEDKLERTKKDLVDATTTKKALVMNNK